MALAFRPQLRRRGRGASRRHRRAWSGWRWPKMDADVPSSRIGKHGSSTSRVGPLRASRRMPGMGGCPRGRWRRRACCFRSHRSGLMGVSPGQCRSRRWRRGRRASCASKRHARCWSLSLCAPPGAWQPSARSCCENWRSGCCTASPRQRPGSSWSMGLPPSCGRRHARTRSGCASHDAGSEWCVVASKHPPGLLTRTFAHARRSPPRLYLGSTRARPPAAV